MQPRIWEDVPADDARVRETAEALRLPPVIARLPIWTFHGADDDVSPADNTREMVARLRALGSPVRYTEYPGVGHNSGRRAYEEPELFRWLFAQKRGTGALTGSDAPRPAP